MKDLEKYIQLKFDLKKKCLLKIWSFKKTGEIIFKAL
jgi:hypothetical protein